MLASLAVFGIALVGFGVFQGANLRPERIPVRITKRARR
jgi:hypothetical protein